jgi:hypothetical protein
MGGSPLARIPLILISHSGRSRSPVPRARRHTPGFVIASSTPARGRPALDEIVIARSEATWRSRGISLLVHQRHAADPPRMQISYADGGLDKIDPFFFLGAIATWQRVRRIEVNPRSALCAAKLSHIVITDGVAVIDVRVELHTPAMATGSPRLRKS